MAIYTTGPIDNSSFMGVRETQIVTVNIVNRDAINPYNLVIQGFVLDVVRTMYVNETVNLAPNQVLTKNYFADLDAFEFVFTTVEEVEAEIGISVWGKQNSGALVDPHRIVAWEKQAVLI
ncbi:MULTISPECIES: hypothetical protein [Paenibacillus]|uniref:hypothetical protein n=1 Tax=Paenibacillus TaxID=44249 RepID=UPI00096C6221|nr:hypothetical protein [Paenibacillus odorifer]OMC95621.1 hypothetical protein BJP46_29150 [Paenibacillus odorifer]OMD01089.1 hypothetical protein BJP49_27745 [Paenibacillus odorifer]OMD14024.1 hypothetical protein BJP50_22615 [Paenibacillus odorifer]OMD14218.1 hypothetical protein BJP47_22995 [Paenibacillus odorifer]OME45600.1 hypothetical protein BSK59_31935 [Paenibacillus odorifer]